MRIFKRKGVAKLNAPEQNQLAQYDASFHLKEGLQHYHRGNFYQALVSFTKAINLDSSESNLYKIRGATYEALHKKDNAEKDFLKALQLAPEDFFSAYRLGMLYSQRRLVENAANWLKIAFHNSPYVNTKGTEKETNTAFSVGVDVIASSLGKLLLQLHRPQEANDYLDKAIENHPDVASLHFLKGMALAQVGRPAEGIPFLETAVGLGLSHASAALETLRRLVP